MLGYKGVIDVAVVRRCGERDSRLVLGDGGESHALSLMTLTAATPSVLAARWMPGPSAFRTEEGQLLCCV